MNLTKATLGQLVYLSRYSWEWRYEALLELDRRIRHYDPYCVINKEEK